MYQEIVENIKKQKVFVVATIVKTKGSTPRKQGAKVIVYTDATISGTIGGGDFERLVIDDSLELIKNKSKNLLKKYSFSQLGENATGMCCGGNVEVFMELHAKQNRIVIYGGGHIGKELIRIADSSSFNLTVVDDRQDVVNSFDETITCHLADTEYSGNLPVLDDNCFVVIVSRSHQTDCVILESVIKSKSKYIGLIGSKAKTSKIFVHLIENGIDKKLLVDVKTPIGLEIHAESPFEIAISILAEIISVNNAK